MSRDHFILPDAQVRPGVNTDHLEAAGNYIEYHRPDVVVNLGDWWDMHSLSSYDRGTKKAEGNRYMEDIASGKEAMDRLIAPISYYPEMHFLIGNHEQRIERFVNATPELYGELSYDDFELEAHGWTVHDFLKIVTLDGLNYAHYFAAKGTGRAMGAQASTMLKQLGFSFVAGHRQGLESASLHLNNGKVRRGLIGGSFYSHNEAYLGYQGNNHYRGCIHLHEVSGGDYRLEELPLEYLMKHYM